MRHRSFWDPINEWSDSYGEDAIHVLMTAAAVLVALIIVELMINVTTP